MLFRSDVLEKIKAGEVSLVFRKWRKPGAKAGGTQLTQAGVIAIDLVEHIHEDELTEQDARDAGAATLDELRKDLAKDQRGGELYRIRLHYIGEDPRIALRSADKLSDIELHHILAKLAKMDATSKRGPWTREYLQLIHDMPATHAIVLARSIGQDNLVFKPNVRKLKALGLTISLSPGYRLSPRGEKVLIALRNTR
jgi:hypothetical protein